MNLGQSLLTTAALIIITLVVISANRLILESQQDELMGEAYHMASEIANSMLMEASKKVFDPNPWYSGYSASDCFTPVYMLGPNSTEQAAVPLPDRYPFKSIAGYSDFDDYNLYTRVVDTPLITGFQVRDSVFYVSSGNADVPNGYPTALKKMIVTVTHSLYLPKPLQFSTVKCY